MTSALTRWASLQSRLKEARKAMLEAEGLSEKGLRLLKAEALADVEIDFTDTEFGLVQRIKKGKVTWHPRQKAIDDTPILSNYDLILITKDE